MAVLDGPCATDAPPAAFLADAAEGVRLCRELGWRAGEAYALVALASGALGDGRIGDALRDAEHALAIAESIGHQQRQVIALLTLGIAEAELLDAEGACALPSGARPRPRRWRGAVGRTTRRLDRLDPARRRRSG